MDGSQVTNGRTNGPTIKWLSVACPRLEYGEKEEYGTVQHRYSANTIIPCPPSGHMTCIPMRLSILAIRQLHCVAYFGLD